MATVRDLGTQVNNMCLRAARNFFKFIFALNVFHYKYIWPTDSIVLAEDNSVSLNIGSEEENIVTLNNKGLKYFEWFQSPGLPG